MGALLTRDMLPVGTGFRPTEYEIINHYLRRRLRGLKENWQLIPDLDIYQWEPDDLFKKYDEMSELPSDGRECFFFCIRIGSNRMTGAGFWKETRKRHIVKGSDGNPIWSKKILVYYEGRQPKGTKSHYSMHEYHLFSPSKPETKGPEMELVLCRIIDREDKIASFDSLLSDPDPVCPVSSTTASHLDNTASPQFYESKENAEPQLQRSNPDQFQADAPSCSSSSTAFDPSSFFRDDDCISMSDLLRPP